MDTANTSPTTVRTIETAQIAAALRDFLRRNRARPSQAPLQ
jgi:hypothetical protein